MEILACQNRYSGDGGAWCLIVYLSNGRGIQYFDARNYADSRNYFVPIGKQPISQSTLGF